MHKGGILAQLGIQEGLPEDVKLSISKDEYELVQWKGFLGGGTARAKPRRRNRTSSCSLVSLR